MYIDARQLPAGHKIDCDVCIIGAGAAGITIGKEFKDTSRRICIIESGGFEYDSLTQSLYHGLTVGVPYFSLLSTRLRFFGGTTNHWGGNCHPFSADTFEQRDWVPNSGWPFGRETMDPYYDRAAKIVGLPDRAWEHKYWITRAERDAFLFGKKRFETYASQLKRTRFNIKYRSDFETSKNVDVYLNANLIEFITQDNGESVKQAMCRCLTGAEFSVRARRFILAAGGIENPRLLLLSNRHQEAGLGNKHDIVGRYFMDQPRFVAASIAPIDQYISIWPHGESTTVGKVRYSVQLRLQLTEQKKYRIGAGNVSLIPVLNERYEDAKRSRGVRSMRALYRDLRAFRWPTNLKSHVSNLITDLEDVTHYSYTNIRHGSVPLKGINCSIRFEPVPNRDSRVYLGTERDALGQRRVTLDWRLSETDKETVRRTVDALGEAVGQAGFGRVKSFVSSPTWEWPSMMVGGHHHIGTTRMHTDPALGVVDQNCKVHGIDNLYIAGSSVFPTAGLGWPTYTLIALAIRLADHIKGNYA